MPMREYERVQRQFEAERYARELDARNPGALAPSSTTNLTWMIVFVVIAGLGLIGGGLWWRSDTLSDPNSDPWMGWAVLLILGLPGAFLLLIAAIVWPGRKPSAE